MELLGNPKLAFNWDGGTAERITIGATGGYRMEIEVQGLASHAGVAPEEGVSAIAIASLAIGRLHEEGWHGQIAKGKRRGTSNIGFIHGGAATNVVTDRVQLKAEARSHDPKFRKQIVEAIETSVPRCGQASSQCRDGQRGAVTIDGRLDYESFRLADDEPCVLAAEAALRSVGLKPFRAISNGGLGRQLDDRARHSHRHAGLRPDRSAHGFRTARHRRVSSRLPRRLAVGDGENESKGRMQNERSWPL